MTDDNKVNIVVLGDFNRDMLLLSEPSTEEKSTKKVFRWFGGSILLADLIKQALEIPLESTEAVNGIQVFSYRDVDPNNKNNHKYYWEKWIEGKKDSDECLTLFELFPKDKKREKDRVYRIREFIARTKGQDGAQDNNLSELTEKSINKVKDTGEKEPYNNGY
jgi:hypothetical protein